MSAHLEEAERAAEDGGPRAYVYREELQQRPVKADKPDYITITHGMRGYFAVHMRWYDEDGLGMYEPEQSGMGSYRRCDHPGLLTEAQQWANAIDVEFRR